MKCPTVWKFTFLLTLFFLFPPEISQANTILHHDLELHLDLSTGGIEVEDRIEVQVDSTELKLDLHKNVKIERITYRGEVLNPAVDTEEEESKTSTIRLPEETAGKIVKIKVKYTGEFPQIDFSDGRHRGTEVGAYINKDAALLLADTHWYPVIRDQKELITYDLKVYAEDGQVVISAGKRRPPGGFLFKRRYTSFCMRHPTDQINLVSGPYHVRKAKASSLDLYTFLTHEDTELENTYLSAMQEHLQQFQERFGPYPYDEMSLVETPLMEGLGFPGFTIIGEKLLRIPNLPRTSLGHEILHNWWGNGVYPDTDRGNWSEGLVTYLVDHNFSSEKLGAPTARRRLLESYSIYTQSGREASLANFQERDTPQAMAVGYHKSAFLFGMIEQRLGKDRFDQALRQFAKENMFKTASWEQLQSAFEAASGESMSDFFRQWVSGVGAPTIRIREAHIHPESNGREVTLTLESEPLFRYDLPIEIKTGGERTTTLISIKESPQTITLRAPSEIQVVTVDPNYTVLRKLLPEELPATIASVLETDSDLPVVFSGALTQEDREQYENFLKVSEIHYHEVSTLEETDGPALLLGPPPETGAIGGYSPSGVPWTWHGTSLEIEGTSVAGGKDAAVFAWRGPKGASQPVVWIVGYSHEGLESLAMRLGYFIASSYVLLREGKSPVRGEWKSDQKPLQIDFQGSGK